ncbi:hypothetical protein cyc_06991 [Cyclospora cayetanensis]|uniref:Transmembrane protein n=1 Tax=Cyclospora cayetanensis TaxID=88456 RepID=A0A1D3D1A9_9EIME|nr:hypothetical protein cyc_06991 [Cyclospora cayetanensis]
MISLCLVPFVFGALVSAAVEEHNETSLNTGVDITFYEAGSAHPTHDQAVARTHLQSFQKDKDGFGGKKKLAKALAAALGICLATLLLSRWLKSKGIAGYGKSVHEEGLPEEVSTTG